MKYFTKQLCRYKPKFFSAKKIEKQWQKANEDYLEHCRQIEPYLPEFFKCFNIDGVSGMHDCLITGNGFVGKNFSMDIDSSGGFCNVKNLTFINAEILESDSIPNNNAFWLYDEVYFYQDRKDRYEMHILFAMPHYGLAEMIIVFDDIIIDGN